jgi:acetylornithine aminotransferase
VLDSLIDDGLIERAEQLGHRIVAGLQTALKGNNHVVDIRGKGLMIAVELGRPCTGLVAEGLDAGVLINVTKDNTVRLLPPLTLTDQQADELVALVSGVIGGFAGNPVEA